MINTLRKFFAPPVFEDEEKTRSAYFLNIIVLSNIPILALFIFIRTSTGDQLFGVANIILMAIITILVIAWFMIKQGWVYPAGYLHVTTIWLASTMIALSGNGIRGTAFTSYFVVMLMAGLLLGWRPAVGYTVLSILAVFGLAVAENTGIVHAVYSSPFSVAIEGTVLFFFGGIFLWLIISSLQNAVAKAKVNARNLQASNQELTSFRDALELRVQERTAALEKQTYQLQTVASVARAIASVQDLDALLPEITNLVSSQFGFYHVGIFLLDGDRKNAILRAANSEGGKRMLARHHQLKLDANSIVGYTTSREEPRIALDVGTDAVYFNNPDLSDTRSEIALPLRIGKTVIGALDVQSRFANAFSQDDISALSTLADQIAIAIENARLLSESRDALKTSEETFNRYFQREWNSFTSQAKSTGYMFDGNRTIPLDSKDKQKRIQALPQTDRLTLEKDAKDITISIRLRGQVIGYLDVKPKNTTRKWTQDDMILLEAAAERAALALENARLVETAERRASRERTIGEISTKIGAVSDLDAIMQAAVEELGRKIGSVAEVTLELDTEQDKS
jgi:GAF domain-containing protein